jgi:myo-inositol-1(or 4)-monophosphatase
VQAVVRDPLILLRETADEIAGVLSANDDWAFTGIGHGGQYAHDVVADQAAHRVLDGAGVRVLSEESGMSGEGELLVVLDPVDGSTNASLGIPHWCTSIAAFDHEGPVAGLVHNPSNGERFEAERGSGATLGDLPISPTRLDDYARATVGITGYPPARPGWGQFRAMGAAALDLCYVACGRFDAFAGLYRGLEIWDYAAGLLICTEAGGVIREADGLDPFAVEVGRRAFILAACTTPVLDGLHAAVRE